MKNNFVSIIIPCYNAAEFILDTIKSILKQTHSDFELIIVNDGSLDHSELIIKTIHDDRLRYYYQTNKGVSNARNFGLTKATGDYVIFFDADDIMTNDFIGSRIESYAKNLEYGAVCGPITKFNQNGYIEGSYRGPDNINLIRQILSYSAAIITCPSNFMFKRIFLINNNIKFNENLSSTADRFFLLEYNKYGTLFYDENISPLNYRVNSLSMSHKLTKSLVADNELFYSELKRTKLVPKELTKVCFFYGYYILSGANYKINNYYLAIKFGIIAFAINPSSFIAKITYKKT